jgi:hypothetical protein
MYYMNFQFLLNNQEYFKTQNLKNNNEYDVKSLR